MIQHAEHCGEAPATLPFLRPGESGERISRDVPFLVDDFVPLRRFYDVVVLPLAERELAPRSIKSDRLALARWEECTHNRDVRDIGPEDIAEFRDALLTRGRSPATVNTYWIELRAMLREAVERGVIDKVPRPDSYRRRAKLCATSAKRQREALTELEVERLWKACAAATYPAETQYPAAKLWRVALVLLWYYGPRPSDLWQLRQSDVKHSEKLLQFEAIKTGKLQGLHTPELVQQHLRSISGFDPRLFPGFVTTGHRNRRTGRIAAGYYSTWRFEILPAAGMADDAVTFKNFRESMVTRYNGLEPGLGAWVAGHSVPGVTAQNYEKPTARIRAAIDASPVPVCFADIG